MDLPGSAIQRHNFITTPDGKGVLSIGGWAGGNGQDRIYELKCTQSLQDCNWITLTQKLKYPRYSSVAMLIPDSLATDLCNL